MNKNHLNEVAALANAEFQKMLPGLTGYARALTKRSNLHVQVTSQGSHTNGTDIFLQPPSELANKLKHSRALCDTRDSRTLKQLCDLCATQENILIRINHEIAHLAFGTFDKPKADHVSETIRDSVLALDTRFGEYLRTLHLNANLDYMRLAQSINPYLPTLLNALEDVRVDSSMFKARRGTKVMYEAYLRDVLDNGIDTPNDGRVKWADAKLNSQVIIGVFLKGSDYDPLTWLSTDLKPVFEDAELSNLLKKLTSMKSVTETYSLLVPVFARLRAYGFLADKDHEPPNVSDDPEPPKQEEEKNEEQDESSQKEEGSSGDDESDGPDEPESDSSGSGRGDGNDSEDSSSNEEAEENNSSDGDSGSSEAGQDSEESSGEGSKEDVDGDSDPSGEEGGSSGDDEAECDGERSPSTGSLSEESDSGSESPTEGDVSNDDDSELEESDDTQGSGGREDSKADEQLNDDLGESSRSDDGDFDEPERGSDEAPFDGDSANTDEGKESGNHKPEEVDTGAWDEDKIIKGGNYGSPDEVASEFTEATHHNLPKETTSSDSEDYKNALQISIEQGSYFEKPSARIAGVRVYGRNDYSFNDPFIKDFQKEILESNGFAQRDPGTPEQILGPALFEMRRILAENERANMQPHLKSGKINKRVLGKRAWSGDPRLFQKKTIPGKRSYSVLLGIDISGSTLGVNIELAKRAAFAQAELCHRLGIEFAVYAHSTAKESSRGDMYLAMYPLKEFDEPWNLETQNALSSINSSRENLDGHTIEFYRKLISQRRTTDRLILYYSDGKMPAANHAEELNILRSEIETCKKLGIALLGVGIRTDSPRRHGLDTVQVDGDEDVVSVVRHLEDALLAAR